MANKLPDKVTNTRKGGVLVKRTLTFFNCDDSPTSCDCANMRVTVRKGDEWADFETLTCDHTSGPLQVKIGSDFEKVAWFIADSRKKLDG